MITSIDKALVVDDDVLMREFVVETLKRNGIKVVEAGNGLEAKNLLQEQDFDLAFIDLKMPGMTGTQLLNFITESKIDTLSVIITAFGTVERAVEAMRMGAYDFLMKPFSPEQVELIVKRARDLVKLQAENAYLKEELGWKLPRGREMLGKSEKMRSLMKTIENVATSSATALISGESGTGKELVALAIHSLGAQRDGPFIRMNCAAVPDELMDSEMFGHEKGAFTSAITRRIGRFELANNGTLLLDEISELKNGLQAKLLRVLQEREFERVGGNKTIATNCRVIAMTNRNLQEHIRSGAFRQDLFYRINVLPIAVPSLRERAEDIPLLADAFLKRCRLKAGKDGDGAHFTEEALDTLCNYSWPGNVRELENMVERLSVMTSGDRFGAEVLPPEVKGEIRPVCNSPAATTATFNIAQIERDTIMKALASAGGNRKQTAKLLGISERTLRNKITLYRSGDEAPAA